MMAHGVTRDLTRAVPEQRTRCDLQCDCEIKLDFGCIIRCGIAPLAAMNVHSHSITRRRRNAAAAQQALQQRNDSSRVRVKHN